MANKVGSDFWMRLISADGTDDPYRPYLGGRYIGRDGRTGFSFPGEREARREAMEAADRAAFGLG